MLNEMKSQGGGSSLDFVELFILGNAVSLTGYRIWAFNYSGGLPSGWEAGSVANMVVHTDLNMLSVLQYAVEVLKVKHIIVCGHYGCGGVKAAMTNHSMGLINKWLRNIKDVYRYHQDEIELLKEEDLKLNRLIELNVVEQVMNLAKTSIIQKSWLHEKGPHLHGWVYDLHDGILRPQIHMPPGSHLDHPIFEYDNL